MSQLIVVMFLVYSGYGIMESYRRKRTKYLQGFLKNRVLRTLIHFDIAVSLFLILAIVLGHEYTTEQYLLSWIGWLSIGNSNWFMFDIISLYLLAYCGLFVVERYKLSEKTYLWIIFALSCSLQLFLLKTKNLWWYDTILAFPIGMLWSAYRKQIEKFCSEPQRYWAAFMVIASCFLLFLFGGRNYKAAFLFIASPLFGILVIMLSMKMKIGNAALNWLGTNAFAIYILQRLSMIVASEYGLNQNSFIFMAVVIPATLIIAALFTSFTNCIDRKLFS